MSDKQQLLGASAPPTYDASADYAAPSRRPQYHGSLFWTGSPIPGSSAVLTFEPNRMFGSEDNFEVFRSFVREQTNGKATMAAVTPHVVQMKMKFAISYDELLDMMHNQFGWTLSQVTNTKAGSIHIHFVRDAPLPNVDDLMVSIR